MAKEDVIEFDGVVDEILPGGQFRVRLDSDQIVLAYTAGKMRKNRIRTLVGDRVIVEMTPYDLTRGRLIYRHKSETGPTAPGRRVYRPRR
jgi:translation initiation factor IF-1